ncbi:MAG: alpha/beta hydrolase [Vicinamibacterales bacterium]
MAHIVATNGVQLAFQEHGEGEPLVLLHGFTGIGDNWRHVFPDAIPGHRVIIPDLRGHGGSTNPSGSFTFRQSALDIFGLLEHLGIDRFQAIGLSAGAKTLLHMATAQPGRIEAMVLVSATPRIPDPARAIMRMMTLESRTPEDWAQMRQWHPQGDEQIRALWQQSVDFATSHDDMNFTAATLGAITARTLIVHGDRDPLYPVEVAVELYRGIPGSALWVVPHGGHGPIFGEQAAQFAAAAIGFLRTG